MKRFFLFLTLLALFIISVHSQTTVNALRVLETHPNTTAWVLSGQEQLTGQAF
jgi:hypothetical protein